MDGSVLEEKSSFKMLELTFSCKLDWGLFIISIAKTTSKKIGALICSMKFLSLEVTLYHYKSTIWSYMEYCFHVWAGAPSCYLESLDKLQKQIYRTVAPSLASFRTLGSSSKCSQLKSLFIYLFIYLLYFRFIYRWQILFHLTIRLAFYKQQGLSQTSGAINNIAECCYPWHQIFETTSVCGAN